MSSGIRLLRRNLLSNIAGILVPSLGWMLAIPFLVHGLGDQAFGVYTIAMSIAGFLSVLELETSSAATKYIAEVETRTNPKTIEQIALANFAIYLGIGLVVILTTRLISPWLASVAFRDTGMNDQTLIVLIQLAGVLFACNSLRKAMAAIPRGFQRFDIYNAIRISYSIVLILTQVGIVAIGGKVVALMAGNIVVSVASVLAYILVIHRMIPGVRLIGLPDGRVLKMLFSFGMYMMISNVAGISFISADKIIIGRVLGAAAVTYYAVPVGLISRVRSLVAAPTSVFLPLMSELHSGNEFSEARKIYLRGSRFIAVMVALPIVAISLFSKEVLNLWMGTTFAAKAAPLTAVIGLGYLLYSTDIMPYHVLIGIGRPRRMALIHLMAVAIILLGIFGGAIYFGLFGAVVGMIPGMTMMLLFPWTTQRLLGFSWQQAWRDGFGWTLLYSVITVIAGMVLLPHLLLRFFLYCAFLALLVRWGNIKQEDREFLRVTLTQAYHRMREIRVGAGADPLL